MLVEKLILYFFIFIFGMDLLFFYLGKKGLVKFFLKHERTKKVYNKVHKKIGPIIKTNSFSSIFLMKLTGGATLASMLYLGNHMKFRDFIWKDLLANLIITAVLAILIYFFRFSFTKALQVIQNFQIDILIIVVSVLFSYFLIKLFVKYFKKRN